MSNQPLKAVLIGTGRISHAHAQAIRRIPQLTLAACYNRPSEKELGLAFAEQYQVRYYPSISEMLVSEQPQLTINVLPPKQHWQGLEQAASLGSHLVVEKPMANTLAGCRQIADIAGRHRVILAVSETAAFNQLNLTYAAKRERFGRPIHILETNYRHYFSDSRQAWCLDPDEGFGGMIMNVGIHRVARLRLLIGADELSVSASLGSHLPSTQIEGDAAILIRYANGATGVIMICGYHDLGARKINSTRIVTDRGYIIPGEKLNFIHEGRLEKISATTELDSNDYTNFYRAMTASLETGRPSPYSAAQGERDVAVIMATLNSSREQRQVEINELITWPQAPGN